MHHYTVRFLMLLSFAAGCGKQPETTRVAKEQFLKIEINKKAFTPEDELIITISNDTPKEQTYEQLELERLEPNGTWKQIRGRLLCPCLTRCEAEPIVLKPNEKKLHRFTAFYEVKGESAPHTIFCGMMKPADFRLKVFNHETQPVTFTWLGDQL